MRPDERDAARRVAGMDQARAGMTDVADLTVTFYRTLRRNGLPRRLCNELTMLVAQAVIPRPDGPGR